MPLLLRITDYRNNFDTAKKNRFSHTCQNSVTNTHSQSVQKINDLHNLNTTIELHLPLKSLTPHQAAIVI